MAYKLIFEERPQSTETSEKPPVKERFGNSGVVSRETPAPYFLAEILYLHKLSLDERREVHKAKLAYGDVRLWQDG
jgi:hypothetical protein